jgi:hypothetical protein
MAELSRDSVPSDASTHEALVRRRNSAIDRSCEEEDAMALPGLE